MTDDSTGNDPIDSPDYYTKRVPGIQCRDVAGHFNYHRGSAIKYLWRAGGKGDEIQDLRQARKHIDMEIARLVQLKARAGLDVVSAVADSAGRCDAKVGSPTPAPPTEVLSDGTLVWRDAAGLIHRGSGWPAVCFANGRMEHWVHGKQVTADE